MDRYCERADRRPDRPESANESKVERPVSNNYDAGPKRLDQCHDQTEGKIYQEANNSKALTSDGCAFPGRPGLMLCGSAGLVVA